MNDLLRELARLATSQLAEGGNPWFVVAGAIQAAYESGFQVGASGHAFFCRQGPDVTCEKCLSIQRRISEWLDERETERK